MKKYITSVAFFCYCCLLLTSCNTATPEKYFDLAVLNSNMITGFADEWELKQMEPSPVMLNAARQSVTIKRSEALSAKIKFLDEDFEKLKGLKETIDTKEMLEASKTLYEYVLPVYKTEYMEVANLYEEGASKEKIQTRITAIHDKYYPQYKELVTKLIGIGKLYAERHAIKVNWGS
ncbi:MAG: hypothetical protein ABIQ31_19100 [Ferruginibacter sp.]